MGKVYGRMAWLVGLAMTMGLASGCRVDTHRDGENKDVKIATPFGGLSVKTNEAAVQGGVGLSVYPGAVPFKKDKDNGAADVNLNFGSFHLGVKAVSYQTGDSPETVMAFYRKDMARYGEVILCRDEQAVGTPTRTQEGLTCEREGRSEVHVSEGGSAGELKAGSKQHQHLVQIDRVGAGTKIELVALDLPSHLGVKDDS